MRDINFDVLYYIAVKKMTHINIDIYDVSFYEKHFSIIGFTSPVMLVNEANENGEINLDGRNVLNYEPRGKFRPIVNDNDLPAVIYDDDDLPVNEDLCKIIESTDEYLFFELQPEAIATKLRLFLSTPDAVYPVSPKVTHKKSIGFETFHKMLRRWKYHTIKNFTSVKESIILKIFEIRKLKKMDMLLRKLIVDEYKFHYTKIENTNQTYIEASMQIFELKKNFCSLLQYLSLLSDTQEKTNKSKHGTQNSWKIKLFNFILNQEVFQNNKTLQEKNPEEEFEEVDRTLFLQKLNSIKEDIKNLEHYEIFNNRCSVTFGSIFEDLLDDSFPKLLKLEKIAFLRYFNITGIPILAAINEDSQENPWRLTAILSDQNNINSNVSQTVVNNFLDKFPFEENPEDIETTIVKLDSKTYLNAVVPVLTPKSAHVLKPLFSTNIFASVCSYSVLRNPFSVIKGVHFAALICVLVKLINLQAVDQLNYIREKLKSVCATASIYLDSPDLVAYKNELIKSPKLTLRRNRDLEEREDCDCKIYSENLAKPLFFLYIFRDDIGKEKVVEILRLLVHEFVYRLISNLLSNNDFKTVLKYFFASNDDAIFFPNDVLNNKIYSREVLNAIDRIIFSFKQKNEYLKNHHKTATARKILKKYCTKYVSRVRKRFSLNLLTLFECKDEEGIGDFTLTNLKTMSLNEFNISHSVVKEIFGVENICCYIHQSLFSIKSGVFIDKTISYHYARALLIKELRKFFAEDVYNGICVHFKEWK